MKTVRARTAAMGAILAAATVLVVIGAHTRPTGYVSRHHLPAFHSPIPAPVPSESSPATPSPLRSATERAGGGVPPWVGALVYVALFAMLVAVVVVIVRSRSGSTWRGRHGRNAAEAPGEHAQQAQQVELSRRLADAATTGLDALESGPVEDAIVACWLRLQDAAMAAGVQPDETDTPAEYVTRVLEQSRIRPEPLAVLADLYREARFSSHQMTENDRASARASLEAISADLGAGAHA